MLNVKTLLTNALSAIYSRPTYASSSNTITNTDIDTLTAGASITCSAGHCYLIVGQWPFYSGSSVSTARNMLVAIRDTSSSTVVAQHRVYAAYGNWACLQVVYITDYLSSDTTYRVEGASSMTYTTATTNWIKAIPIGA